MDNPYKKPASPRLNHLGKVMFYRFSECKWSFFEASGGKLWWSGERIKFTFEYCRDYTATVFERYVRRFGCLDPIKALTFENRVATRWGWYSHAVNGYSPEFAFPKKLDRYETTSGPFCPIGAVRNHVTVFNLRTDEISRNLERQQPQCVHCGSPLRVKSGVVITKQIAFIDMLFYAKFHWHDDGIREDISECTSEQCRKARALESEAVAFMAGRHSVADAAQNLNVPMNRPLRQYRDASAEDKMVIAAAALLDFEARFEKKKSSMQSAIDNNGSGI